VDAVPARSRSLAAATDPTARRLFEFDAVLAPIHIAAPSSVREGSHHATFAARLERYPRIRFMGSKYRLAARLAELFEDLPPGSALDAFSGSGVVAYTLKATGRPVLANDELTFATTLAEATVPTTRPPSAPLRLRKSAQVISTGATSSPLHSMASTFRPRILRSWMPRGRASIALMDQSAPSP